jgi:hypothetical protein
LLWLYSRSLYILLLKSAFLFTNNLSCFEFIFDFSDNRILDIVAHLLGTSPMCWRQIVYNQVCATISNKMHLRSLEIFRKLELIWRNILVNWNRYWTCTLISSSIICV